jgi:tRNA-dihydrouridine synthase
MRLGKSAGCDYVAFAKMCESAGAARIIVHGRYGDAGYSGVANWDAIGEIVRAVKIPVIANGDIKCVDDARRCLEITGAAGVMVGRGLLPIYKKYFSRELRTLSCDKICRSINPCIDNVIELLRCTE